MLVLHLQCVSLGYTNTGCLTCTLPLKIIVKVQSCGLRWDKLAQKPNLHLYPFDCTHISNSNQELHLFPDGISNEKLNSCNQIQLVLTNVNKFKIIQMVFKQDWTSSAQNKLVPTSWNQFEPDLIISDCFRQVSTDSKQF